MIWLALTVALAIGGAGHSAFAAWELFRHDWKWRRRFAAPAAGVVGVVGGALAFGMVVTYILPPV